MLIGTIQQIWRYPVTAKGTLRVYVSAGHLFRRLSNPRVDHRFAGRNVRVKSRRHWDVRRFRPNFFVKTVGGIEGLVESEWAGRTLRIGSVELKCEMPAVRCGMTTNAQTGLAKDNSVLRTIVKEAKQNLGVYASVVGYGRVSEGDEVELSLA